VKPIQLFGHLKEAQALDFIPGQPVLVSGGRDGMVLLWMPHRSTDPALIAQRRAEISTLRWSPDGRALAFGTAEGEVTLSRLTSSLTQP
jgi:WD40 repeat protein